MKKKTIKWILGIIGIIFLGAIGSGLWQIGIAPVGSWILDVIFKVTTLGLSSLEDAFYRDVAKGLHEEPSVFALSLFLFSFGIFCGCIWSFTFIFTLGDRALKLHKINKKWLVLIMQIITIFIAIPLIFQCAIIARRNRIITDFRQAFTIGKPMLTEEEEEEILSKFSMIKNKQDYLNVSNMLIEMTSKKVQDLKSSSVKDKTEQ